jgi:hypothetical protein
VVGFLLWVFWVLLLLGFFFFFGGPCVYSSVYVGAPFAF